MASEKESGDSYASSIPIVIESPSPRRPDETPAERRKRRKEGRDAARLAHGSKLRSKLRDGSPPRIVTIYSEGELATDLEVLEQMKYTGTAPVIPSSLAALSCTSMGLQELLQQLNDVLRTTYTLDTPSLSDLLQIYINRGFDFGTILGYLRPYWFWDFTTLAASLQEIKAEDTEMRQSAIDSQKNQIVKPLINPRRVWDLYSNRVLPTWVIRKEPWAVSHSWMEWSLRHNVDTPINCYEWPVPIPIDTTLERVRVELLNLGAEYIWLDVLCLRQEGSPEKEPLRLEEWKLDVPTIGNVYHQNQWIVHYYSGLGRPFLIGDMDNERHWLNRAWTLQEISPNSVIGGVAACSPVKPIYVEGEGYADSSVGRFYDALGSLSDFSQEVDNIFLVLEAMRRRAAISELDKIAGLAYLLRSPVLPGYIPNQPEEDAWRQLLETTRDRYRGDLLFLYPTCGNGANAWTPSWQQIKETSLPATGGVYLMEDVSYVSNNGVYRHRGYRLERCLVKGLSESDHQSKYRIGVMSITSGDGIRHDFQIRASHPEPIPEGYYVLIGSSGCQYWVIGLASGVGSVKKVSVAEMVLSGDQDKIRELKLGQYSDSDFL